MEWQHLAGLGAKCSHKIWILCNLAHYSLNVADQVQFLLKVEEPETSKKMLKFVKNIFHLVFQLNTEQKQGHTYAIHSVWLK